MSLHRTPLIVVAQHLHTIKVIQAQGTCLLWLDCRSLDKSDAKLREARVGMNPGTIFGNNGSGYMRLNIASRRRVIAEALGRIKEVLVRR